MLYKYENNELSSFEVNVDYDKLKMIKEEIIENCSIIKKCEGTYSDECIDNIKYSKNKRNYVKGDFVYRTETFDGNINYYKYTYDEYYFPEIVDIFYKILNGENSKINDLFTTEDMKNDIDAYRDNKVLDTVVNLIVEYKKTNNENSINSAKRILSEFYHPEIIMRNKSIKDYYDELIDCFSFKKVFSINDLEIEKLKEILGNNWKEKITNFFDYQENNRKLVTNQYVKRLMK